MPVHVADVLLILALLLVLPFVFAQVYGVLQLTPPQMPREQTSALFWHVIGRNWWWRGRQPAWRSHSTRLFKVGIGFGFPQDESIGFEPAQNEGIGFQNGHRFSMTITVIGCISKRKLATEAGTSNRNSTMMRCRGRPPFFLLGRSD